MHMSAHAIKYTAWFLLVSAIAAWVGVGFFGWVIARDRAALVQKRQTAQEQSLQYEAAARIHAMAQGTTQERTRVENILNAGVVSAADTIESAGKASGVRITLGGATPENTSVKIPGMSVQGIGFAVDGEGSFSALVRAVQLFETLPLPSVLRRYELERSSSASGGKWTMHAYITMLTTAGSAQ